MAGRRNVRIEDYIFDINGRNTAIQRVFEKQMVSKALLEFKWTKHIQMGCDATKRGHREDISAMDLDDGEEMLLFGSHGGSISVQKYKYLSRKKWRKPMSLNLQNKALKTVKWCPLDLRMFMVTTASGWMRVCDTTVGREIRGKKFVGDIYFDWNEFNTTNSRVAVTDGTETISLIDFRVGMDLPQIINWDHRAIDVVQWYPGKQHYLYAGRRDGTIGVFDVRSTRSALAEKKIHTRQIYGLRLSDDGLRVISMDATHHIHVGDTWDFSTKAEWSAERCEELVPRRPDLKVITTPDLYVATNIMYPSVYHLTENQQPVRHRIDSYALYQKSIVFRKSSFELITGHGYNYLNVLSFARAAPGEEEEEAANLPL